MSSEALLARVFVLAFITSYSQSVMPRYVLALSPVRIAERAR